jgi:hypothetical protein
MTRNNIIIAILALALLAGCNTQGGANLAGGSTVNVTPAAGSAGATTRPSSGSTVNTDMSKTSLASGLLSTDIDKIGKLIDAKVALRLTGMEADMKAVMTANTELKAAFSSVMDTNLKLTGKLAALDNSKTSFDKAAADMVKDHAAQAKGDNNRVFSFDGSAWPLLVFMIVVTLLVFVMVVIWWFFHKTKRHAENLTYGLTQLMQATEDENSDQVKANFSKRIQHSSVAPIVDRLLTNTIIRKKD